MHVVACRQAMQQSHERLPCFVGVRIRHLDDIQDSSMGGDVLGVETLTLAMIATAAGKAAATFIGKAVAEVAASPVKRKVKAWVGDRRLEAAYADASRAFLEPLKGYSLDPQNLANLKEMVEATEWTDAVSQLIYPNFGQIDTAACQELFRVLKPAEVEEGYFVAGWQRLTDGFKHAVASSDSEALKFLIELSAREAGASQGHDRLESSQRQEVLLAAILEALTAEKSATAKPKPGKKQEPRKSAGTGSKSDSPILDAIESARGHAHKAILVDLDPDVITHLVAQRKVWRGKSKTVIAKALCNAKSLDDVASTLNRAHEAACDARGGGPAASKIEWIAARVVPTVFWAQLGVGTAAGQEALRHELPVAFDFLVELVLAGLEGKPYAFNAPAEDAYYPSGKHKLPLPGEGGIEEGVETFDELLDHLASQVLKFDPRLWNQFRGDRKKSLKFFGDQLRGAAAGPKGRRWYFAANEEDRINSADLLVEIEKHLKQVRVVYMVADPKPEEVESFRPIRDLLVRANQRRKFV